MNRLIILLFLFYISSAFSQPPDAGSILQQLEQEQLTQPQFENYRQKNIEKDEVGLEADLRVEIKQIVFQGNENISDSELSDVFNSYLGQKTSFNDLQQLARMVGEYYRGKGLWARAILPEQSLEDGILIIKIIEGKLGNLNIQHGEKKLNIDEEKAKKYLLNNQKSDAIFNIKEFEKSVKNLNNYPGVSAVAILKPGENKGFTDAEIKMMNTSLFSGSLRTDNYGSRSTSKHGQRLVGYFNFDGLLSLGEQINFQFVKSSGLDVKTIGSSFPLGYEGSRIGVSYTDLAYELGHPLTSIDGKGDAQIISIYFNKPLVNEDTKSIDTKIQFTKKNFYNETIAGETSDKSTKAFTANVSFKWQAPAIKVTNRASLSYVFGGLDLRDNDTDYENDSTTAETHGNYDKFLFSFNRSQYLNASNEVWISTFGQYALDNLDSSEKISLGGPTGVRAFPSGEGFGDSGAVVNLELRHYFKDNISGMLFYDYGWVKKHKNTWSNWNSRNEPNHYHIDGAGVGLKWTLNQRFNFLGYLSKRLANNPSPDSNGKDIDGSSHDTRLWISLVGQF